MGSQPQEFTPTRIVRNLRKSERNENQVKSHFANIVINRKHWTSYDMFNRHKKYLLFVSSIHDLTFHIAIPENMITRLNDIKSMNEFINKDNISLF